MSDFPYARNGSTNHGPTRNGEAVSTLAKAPSEQIRSLLAAFWKHKWVFLAILALVIGGAWYYTTTLPRSYQTSTLLLVTKDGDTSPVQFQFSRSSGGRFEPRSLSNEMLVLQRSRSIAERVAKRLIEMGTHPSTGESLQVIRGGNGQVLPAEYVASRLFGHMFVRMEGEDVDAFRIYGRSNVPAEAAVIANTYAEEYIAWTQEKSRESMAASREFLTTQEDKLEAEVKASEDEIKSFMNREGAIALDQESARLVDQIAALEVRRDELQIELDMKQAQLEADLKSLREIEPRLAEQLSSTLSARLSTIQERRAETELRIEAIKKSNPSLTVSDDTPVGREFAKLNERSNELRADADSIASQFVSAAQSASGLPPSITGEEAISRLYNLRERVAQLQIEVSGMEAQMRSIDRRRQEYQQELSQIPDQSFKLAQLQREKRLAEGMYGFVQERLQETRMNEESEIGYAEVLSPAGVPGGPISPDVDRILMLAALFGFLLSGGTVLLLEKMDTRIRRPDDLKDHGFSLVGAVPSMDDLIDSDFEGNSRVEVDGQNMSTSLVMLLSPMSPAAESYRRIRSNLQFARPDKDIRAVTVSSAGKGAGKTTTSMNLALAMASAGKKTIIVDADLRRPRLHLMLDVDDRPYLSQLLFEDVAFDESALETNIDNLSVLPASSSVPNPAEILGSERMADFADRLREKYDFVIFDTAPLLLFSDSISLSKLCDGTILVAATGETDIRAFEHAAAMLQDVNVDLLGCVLNRYDADTIEYGYGYGYTYSYDRMSEYYGNGSNGYKAGSLMDKFRSLL